MAIALRVQKRKCFVFVRFFVFCCGFYLSVSLWFFDMRFEWFRVMGRRFVVCLQVYFWKVLWYGLGGVIGVDLDNLEHDVESMTLPACHQVVWMMELLKWGAKNAYEFNNAFDSCLWVRVTTFVSEGENAYEWVYQTLANLCKTLMSECSNAWKRLNREWV